MLKRAARSGRPLLVLCLAPLLWYHPSSISSEREKPAMTYRQITFAYFATRHHAWERGTNENTNGLVRQYLPKRESMAHLTQHDCNRIATKLNRRPRKRLGYRTPAQCYV
jgi:hypothetical protein